MDVLADRLSFFILKPDIPKTFLVLLFISILSLLLMGMVVFLINLLANKYDTQTCFRYFIFNANTAFYNQDFKVQKGYDDNSVKNS